MGGAGRSRRSGLSFARVMGGLGAGVVALVGATGARAQDDVQLWTPVTLAAPAGAGTTLNLEVQTRYTEDASRLGQLIVRPSLERRFSPRLSGSLGYAFIRTEASGAAEVQEHRLWQQASYTLAGSAPGPRLAGRTRLEERVRENQDGTNVRLRQQVRLEAPLGGSLRAVGSLEGLFNLNGTAWAREGVDQWRTFVGVAAPLGRRVTLEPGYLNQIVVRPGPDRVNHVVSVSTVVRF